jgi:hypothetical protein
VHKPLTQTEPLRRRPAGRPACWSLASATIRSSGRGRNGTRTRAGWWRWALPGCASASSPGRTSSRRPAPSSGSGWTRRSRCWAAPASRSSLGTPTAAPPKWLVDRYPDILPVDASVGWCASSARAGTIVSPAGATALEAARITEAMVRRYGENPFVHAWQTDNEYGDHDTIHSYSDEAKLRLPANGSPRATARPRR